MNGTTVLISGMGGTPWIMNNPKRFLEERGYQCVVLTPPVHAGASISDYLDYFETAIRGLAGPITIFGQSMGGLWAPLLATRLSKVQVEIEALILISPTPPGGIFKLSKANVEMFKGPLLKCGSWNDTMQLSLELASKYLMSGMPEEQKLLTYENLGPESCRVIWEIALSLGVTRVRSREIKPYSTLVVFGDRDRVIPRRAILSTVKKYGAKSLKLPFHGHMLLLEPGWEEVMEKILSWLEENTKHKRVYRQVS